MPRSALFALALVLPLASPASGRVESHACRSIAVTQQAVPFTHVRTLQAAVTLAHPCDWILVAAGVYRGQVTIRTANLHLLTVRNFDRRSRNDGSTGTQVRWLGVRGWRGRYLTAYDDGLLGGYGLWASRSRNGVLAHVYASGFDDSGLYVGACRDCDALVEDATAERNLVGLAATNASGHFRVEHALFRLNAVGVSFNSSQSDPPPPQLGTCDAAANRSPAPHLRTTKLGRCTVFRDNRVVDNNALDMPSETASVRPGAGIGIDLLGSYGDLIADNQIARNRNVGVLGLELPLRGPVRFALAGNRISDNQISGSRLAIALAGTSRSFDNCLTGNQGAPTEPTDLRPFSCAHATTPNVPAGPTRRVLALVRNLHAQLAGHARHRQSPPPPQPTMPAPCHAAPPSPLCTR